MIQKLLKSKLGQQIMKFGAMEKKGGSAAACLLAALCVSGLLTGCQGQADETAGDAAAPKSGISETESNAAETESNAVETEGNAVETESNTIETKSAVSAEENPEGEETASEAGAEDPVGEETEKFRVSEAYADMEPVLIPNPGVGFYLAKEPQAERAHTLKLTKVFEKENAITDEDGWFVENQLEFPKFETPQKEFGEAGNVPEEIPDTFGEMVLTLASYDDDFFYCAYGDYYWSGYMLNLYDRESFAPVVSLDLSGFCRGINWAKAKGHMLYVSFSANTYAENVPDQAYIAAIDLTDMSLLWKTETLVSNAWNFEIIGNEIVCGYGFTAEDDFLYQIDLDTGRILEQIPLRTMAEYIIRRDDSLFVRTYNTNYVFQIVTEDD